MRFRIRDLHVVTLLVAIAAGAWRHHRLTLAYRESVSRMQTLLRENEALAQKAKSDANRLAMYEEQGRLFEQLVQRAQDDASHWRAEYWKRAAYDPGPGRPSPLSGAPKN